MNTTVVLQTGKKERVNFLAPVDLINRANNVAKEQNCSFSELTREALENHVAKIEREKIDQEVAEACKKYYALDEKIVKDWSQFETEIE